MTSLLPASPCPFCAAPAQATRFYGYVRCTASDCYQIEMPIEEWNILSAARALWDARSDASPFIRISTEQEAEIDRLQTAIDRIRDWCRAYPVGAFQELTTKEWRLAAAALKAAGLSLDRISASNMRHVLTGIQAILDTPTKAD